MATFKEIITNDINNVFINQDEFSEKHLVNGMELDVIIDENELIEREQSKQYEGIYKKKVLIYVASSAIRKPCVGAKLSLDNKAYIVLDVTEEAGIYAIALGANKS